MEMYAFLIIGIVLLVIGVINMTGNISSIHAYNRRKVKAEDIPKYGKFVGLGTALIGGGAIAKFILDILNFTDAGWFVFVPLLVIGLLCILYAQFKYNKGIF